MKHKLFTVEDNFNISGRGIIVVGELEDNAPTFRIGTLVSLMRPDGSQLIAEVSGIEMPHPIDYEDFNWSKVGVMLKGVIRKEDAPIGTKVFMEI